eukprot:7098379-Pyramimonas_sp.AAC.1
MEELSSTSQQDRLSCAETPARSSSLRVKRVSRSNKRTRASGSIRCNRCRRATAVLFQRRAYAGRRTLTRRLSVPIETPSSLERFAR